LSFWRNNSQDIDAIAFPLLIQASNLTLYINQQVPDGVSIQELLAGSPAANLENIQINSISSLIEALQEKKMEMENQQEKIQNQVLHR